MTKIREIPFRIPDTWSAGWYRTHFAEVIAKGDWQNGTYVTSSDIATQITAHNADPFSHPDVINAHVAQADPHTQYVQKSATTVDDASGGTTVDAEARAQLNDLLAALRVSGVIGT